MTTKIVIESPKKDTWIGLLLLALFFLAPYIQSDANDSSLTRYLTLIPAVVSKFASLMRWLIIGVLFLITIFKYSDLKKYQSKHSGLFALFYFFPMVFALFTWSDAPRYISLFVLAASIPLVVAYGFSETKGFFNFKNIQIIILINVLLSFLVSYKTIFFGYRFQGILSNSNMYGITAVFWFMMLQLNPNKTKLTYFASLLVLISIFLSGSRGAFIAAVLVTFFAYYKHIKVLILLSLGIIIFGFILMQFINIDFLLERFINVGTSVDDSGRGPLWYSTMKFVDLNPLGNGMNAPMELVGSGNIHNCYIRFLLTMGYPFTIITLLILAIQTLYLYFDKKLPKPLFGFFIGYLAANFGEDFFVGLGSSIFIYVIMLIGIASFYYKKNEAF